MKTNKILMAMVLAAGFTACTSEELVESTQTNALENRKVLGDIEFVMGGVDSRFAIGEDGWTIENNDAFGACLVDTWKGTDDENALNNYSLTNYIQTNYQYAKGEGNKFTTPARMVEGNYVFYAPFNAKHLARKAMEVAAPINQTLDVEDGKVNPYSTINNAVADGYPFFVDYKFLSAADQETSLEINFKHIYSYPEITISNDWDEDVTFEKVVIELEDANALAISSTLKIAKNQAGVASSAAEGIVGSLYNIGTESTTNTFGSWVNKDVKNGLAGATANLLNAGSAKTNYIVVNIPEGLEVKAGKKVTFNVVMPAAQYARIKVYAYTGDVEGYKFNVSTALTFSPGKRYANNDYKNGTLDASKKGKYLSFEFDDEPAEDLPASLPVTVSDNDELLSAIASTEGVLTIIPGSENLEINQEVLDAIAHNEEMSKLIVNGDITVQGVVTPTEEKPALVLEDVEIKEEATIKGIVDASEALKDVVVEEGATLNVAKAITGVLTNNGTVNAKEGAVIATVENKGTLKIENAAATVATLNNYNTLNIAAAGTITTLNNEFDLVEDANNTLDTFGTVNVSCAYSHAADFTGTWNIKDDGILKVAKATAAAIKYAMKIENGGELTGNKVAVKENATLTIEGTLDVEAEMDGDAATSTLAAKPAKIDVKSTAVVSAEISAAASSAENYMTVESASALFLATPDLTDVVSTFTYSGSVSKATDITYPSKAVVNRLVVTGNVQGYTGLLSVGNMNMFTDVEINGNVYVSGTNTLTIGGTNTKNIKIGGHLYLDGTYVLNASESLSVGGTFTNASAFAPTTPSVIFNKIVADANITVTNGIFKSNDITKKDGTTIAASNALIRSSKFDLNDVVSNAIHIEVNTEIQESKKWYAAVTFTVYEGKTLTIPAGVTLNTNGSAGEILTFVSDDTNSSMGVASTASTKVRGQVVNKGAVKNAAYAYSNLVEAYSTWWNKGLTEVAATAAGPHAAIQ